MGSIEVLYTIAGVERASSLWRGHGTINLANLKPFSRYIAINEKPTNFIELLRSSPCVFTAFGGIGGSVDHICTTWKKSVMMIYWFASCAKF